MLKGKITGQRLPRHRQGDIQALHLHVRSGWQRHGQCAGQRDRGGRSVDGKIERAREVHAGDVRRDGCGDHAGQAAVRHAEHAAAISNADELGRAIAEAHAHVARADGENLLRRADGFLREREVTAQGLARDCKIQVALETQRAIRDVHHDAVGRASGQCARDGDGAVDRRAGVVHADDCAAHHGHAGDAEHFHVAFGVERVGGDRAGFLDEPKLGVAQQEAARRWILRAVLEQPGAVAHEDARTGRAEFVTVESEAALDDDKICDIEREIAVETENIRAGGEPHVVGLPVQLEGLVDGEPRFVHTQAEAATHPHTAGGDGCLAGNVARNAPRTGHSRIRRQDDERALPVRQPLTIDRHTHMVQRDARHLVRTAAGHVLPNIFTVRVVAAAVCVFVEQSLLEALGPDGSVPVSIAAVIDLHISRIISPDHAARRILPDLVPCRVIQAPVRVVVVKSGLCAGGIRQRAPSSVAVENLHVEPVIKCTSGALSAGSLVKGEIALQNRPAGATHLEARAHGHHAQERPGRHLERHRNTADLESRFHRHRTGIKLEPITAARERDSRHRDKDTRQEEIRRHPGAGHQHGTLATSHPNEIRPARADFQAEIRDRDGHLRLVVGRAEQAVHACGLHLLDHNGSGNLLAENLECDRRRRAALESHEWPGREVERLGRTADLQFVFDRCGRVVDAQIEVAVELHSRDVHDDRAAEFAREAAVANDEQAVSIRDANERVRAVAQAKLRLAHAEEHDGLVVRGVCNSVGAERFRLLEGEVAGQGLPHDLHRQVRPLDAHEGPGRERECHRHIADVERFGDRRRGVVNLHAERTAQRNAR